MQSTSESEPNQTSDRFQSGPSLTQTAADRKSHLTNELSGIGTTSEQDSFIAREFEKTRSMILLNSQPISSEEFKIKVKGPNFEDPQSRLNIQGLMNSYESIGFQATSLSQSIEIINKMRSWRLSDDDPTIKGGSTEDQSTRIFLGFTSNLISSGLREIIKFLTKHNYVHVIVTTAGGIEEDLIKCLSPTYLTPDKQFNSIDGQKLRSLGLNRIGNLIVPNQNYCKFEDWILPIFDQMLIEQDQLNTTWSPSKVIERLGHEINHPDSFLYWAAKNKIPVFCPALTDG